MKSITIKGSQRESVGKVSTKWVVPKEPMPIPKHWSAMWSSVINNGPRPM